MENVFVGKTKGDEIPINIITEPKDANVFINGNKIDSMESIPLKKGKHDLKISKEGYKNINSASYLLRKRNLAIFLIRKWSRYLREQNLILNYTVEYMYIEKPDSGEVNLMIAI